jgi:hypothetical protein
MKIIQRFNLILLCLLCFSFACDGQSRTNRIYRPCPNSSTPAFIEIERDGDINLKPCTGRTLQQNGTDISIAQPYELAYAVTDETTTIIAALEAAKFHVPRNFTATEVWASVSFQSSSGPVTIDINKNGVSIFSTRITIDQDEYTSLTAAVAPVLSTFTFTKGDRITVDIDQGGANATGLKIYFLGTR